MRATSSGAAEAPQRNLPLEPIEHLLRDGRNHLSQGIARSNGVDGNPDAVVAELARSFE